MCNRELSIENYYKRKNLINRRSNCKECTAIQTKRYDKLNKEKIAENKKQYKQENKLVISISAKQYRTKNKIILAAKASKYQRENRNKFNVTNQIRRTRKHLLSSTLTNEQWNNVIKHFKGLCAYCGEKQKLTIEHFVPVSNFGELAVNNVLPVCITCNCSKNNRDFSVWYPKQKFYSVIREQAIFTYLNYKGGGQQLRLL